MSERKIVVVGSSNTDMVVRVPTLPSAGETVLGGDFLEAAGGKGANQAVAASRLGAGVTLIAKVGEDELGDRALQAFHEEGIVTDYVLRDPSDRSGVALIIVDDAGENLIAVASGANGRLSPEDLQAAGSVIEEAEILLIQLEVPLRTVREAVRLAAGFGTRVILNPAPAQPLDDEILQHVSVLTPNVGEAEVLTGIRVTEEGSAREASDILLESGVESVVITLGSAGSWVADGNSGKIVSPIKIKAVDSTAAGDAFNGALAYALAGGRDLFEAVRFANRVGALAVTRPGAQPSLPRMADLERLEERSKETEEETDR